MRDSKVYIQDIKDAVRRIETYTKGITFASFENNQMLVDAVIRNLVIIGESVKNLPEDIKKEFPDVEWKKIAGLRDILVHAYFGINKKIVWDIIKNKVPELQQLLKDK